ncbi:MAG: 4Fe-4S dicluster domain-containing protein [Halobacteria archaeon]
MGISQIAVDALEGDDIMEKAENLQMGAATEILQMLSDLVDGKIRFVAADPALCIGCHTCEMICSYQKEGVFNPMKARIRVISVGGITTAVARHLGNKCNAEIRCLRRAITQDEITRVVRIDQDKCDGCGFCIPGCDYGCIKMNPDIKKAFVCDQCFGKPICIEYCPTGALGLYTEGEFQAKVEAALSALQAPLGVLAKVKI